jgi:hypothetical protein
MVLNNVLSAGMGFVPIVGDIVLAQFKANSRNAALLEEYLRIRGEEFLKLHAGVASGGVPTAGGIKSTTKGDMKPGAGAAPGERIEAPSRHDIVPESRVAQHERLPQTPGGTPIVASNNAGAQAAPKTSSGGWFKRNKTNSRFVEENATR